MTLRSRYALNGVTTHKRLKVSFEMKLTRPTSGSPAGRSLITPQAFWHLKIALIIVAFW